MSSEILDDALIGKKVVILSKPSIFIIGILISPLLTGILYCYNLYQSNQRDKIFSTLIAIATINFMATVPFMGFKIKFGDFDFSLYIHHFITTSLIVMPLWKKHFKNIKYQTNFPISTLFVILTFLVITFTINDLIFYLVNLYLFSLIVKLIYTIVKPQKLNKRKNTTPSQPTDTDKHQNLA